MVAVVSVPVQVNVTDKQPFKTQFLNEGLIDLALEGIELSRESMVDLLLVDQGRLTMDEAFERTIKRVTQTNLNTNIHPIR